MDNAFDLSLQSAQFIQKELGLKNEELPKLAVVLGSGLGDFAETLNTNEGSAAIPYKMIPNFPVSTTDGHKGQLLFARHKGTSVLVLQGRFHRYEGYSPAQVAFPLRVLAALGVKNFILTNASGGIGDHLEAGDLMLIQDQINFTGDTPLLGKNDDRLGPRFTDMTEAYDKNMRALAMAKANALGISLKEGVYLGVLGPSYETPAEINMFKAWGAHAVGMSTVYETIVARHMNCKVLGIACITNKASGMSDKKLSHEEVKAVAQQSSAGFTNLLLDLLPSLG